MKRSAAILGFALLLSVAGYAQDAPVIPRWEGYGGFSLQSLGTQNNNAFEFDRTQLFGWQAAFSTNLTRMLSVVADFAGQYRSLEPTPIAAIPAPAAPATSNDVHSYQYLLGPRATFYGSKGSGFVHALFGGATNGNQTNSVTGFGMGIGGGLDVNIRPNLALRVAQIDWLPNYTGGVWNRDSFRYGVGLVFKGARFAQ